MKLSPIALFVYNRPWHTRQTLEALALNNLADQSHLIIFADGPKPNGTTEDLSNIEEVRNLIHERLWCKTVEIIESPTNNGLANSIIEGVTFVVNKFGRIIVLEDDIVPSRGFLKYMNEALSIYELENCVGCIHAWNYNIDTTDIPETTFFLKGADCWGWATWKRAWDEFTPDGKTLLNSIGSKKMEFDFNRRNTHAFIEMLVDQIDGKNDSWAIRWHASLFVKNMYCLQPTNPIVRNIGLDNSGVHCGPCEVIQNPVDYISLSKICIEESEWFFAAFSKYLKFDVTRTNIWEKLKTSLKHLLHQ